MKLLIFNASPKKRGGASQFFSGILRLFLPGLVKKNGSSAEPERL